mmetsp:Transcript_35364/g.97839  ORF Transcript_35364/g.97839 Transcript_35364/m.97839 type:complete len:708 (-) Transcript_35364:218-2341(-)
MQASLGNPHMKLALLAAACGVQGVQVPHESRQLSQGPAVIQQLSLARVPDEGLLLTSARGSGSLMTTASTAASVARLMADTAQLSQKTMSLYVLPLIANHSQLGFAGNGSGFGDLSSAESDILDTLSQESTVLFQEWHQLERKSVESASHIAKIAMQSANISGSTFTEQVALQTASLVAQMRALEQQSAARAGKAGPTHAFPQVHVASRRCPNDRAGRAQPCPPRAAALSATEPERAALERAAEEAAAGAVVQTSVGTMRLSLTLAGFFVVFASGLVTANRKTTMGKPKDSSSLYIRSRNTCTGVHEFEHGGNGQALSVWDGTVATFSTVIGTGLLAMPYAMSIAGLAAAPVILFFVACAAYTAHLMVWSFNAAAVEGDNRGVKSSMRGWGFLAEVAFGRKAKSAINTFLIVELWGYLLSSMICAAMNITQIVEELSCSAAVGLSVCVTYALTFAPVSLVTKVSVISNVVFMACCVMYIITGLLLPEKAPSSDVKWINPQGLLSAAGILVFSPAGHSFYPSLMQRMEEPAKFTQCLNRAYAAAAILYLTVALSGYWLFGNAVRPSAVQNIGADLHLVPIPHLGWMNTLAAIGMVIKMIAAQTLVLVPLTSTVEGVLAGCGVDTALNILVAPVFLAVSAGVAVQFASAMAMFLNLLGSIFCMNIVFVVPVVCYWKLSRTPVGISRQIFFVFLILMGLSSAVTGIISAV